MLEIKELINLAIAQHLFAIKYGETFFGITKVYFLSKHNGENNILTEIAVFCDMNIAVVGGVRLTKENSVLFDNIQVIKDFEFSPN